MRLYLNPAGLGDETLQFLNGLDRKSISEFKADLPAPVEPFRGDKLILFQP
jgi:hypothetical protein